MAQLNLLVVTPEKTLVDCHVDSVVLPLFDGQKGILPLHASMIGRLGTGALTATSSDSPDALFIDGGFVQVDDNVVSVMTNTAVKVADLDSESLRQQIDELNSQSVDSDEAKQSRNRQLTQAKAMLQVASR